MKSIFYKKRDNKKEINSNFKCVDKCCGGSTERNKEC